MTTVAFRGRREEIGSGIGGMKKEAEDKELSCSGFLRHIQKSTSGKIPKGRIKNIRCEMQRHSFLWIVNIYGICTVYTVMIKDTHCACILYLSLYRIPLIASFVPCL